ncbi:DUF418 domain-containing protein [Aquibacillus kalidii]|uniref:DUF418 domain-containing protein n=1 Tax=Aquibacillus kalidii TaxID=2762597 RepID=UPI0016469A4D|nr:DUF418 domain-containing protein [Aquibacillus kalidii]
MEGRVGRPLSNKKRLDWIDAARGFAIFGIFMVNVPAFNAPFFLYGGEDSHWTSNVDQFVQDIIDIFFQASFYTMFSFLFGFGMQIIVENLAEKQLNLKPFILRRLFVLLLFGIFHAFLLWHGDILISYAVIGFLLFFFFNRKKTTLIVWSICLLVIPTMLYTGLLYLVRDQLNWVDYEAIDLAFERYGNGSLIDVWTQNYIDWRYSNGIFSFVMLTMSLLPLFLLGMVVARVKWLHDVEKHKTILIRIWWLSLLLFIVLKAGPHLFENPLWFSMIQDGIGGPASAIFYLITITLLFQKGATKKWLYPLTYIGRMSLTNYIFQSIISFLLFYGFQLYGKVSPLVSVLIVIVIFIIQLPLSKWWINRYRYGPLEWVWRCLMYKQRLGNKRAKT